MHDEHGADVRASQIHRLHGVDHDGDLPPPPDVHGDGGRGIVHL
jgi:hypothetical protein